MNAMTETNPAEFALLKHLDSLVDNLRKLIPAALKGQDVEAVHDARVATRRLKAATEMLESVISGRCRKLFDRVTRRLRRQLGPLRDLDVMLEHLAEVKSERFELATTWLNKRLTLCREAAVVKAQKKAPPPQMLARLGSWWGLRQEIAEAHDAVDYLLSEGVHLQLDAFAEQAEKLKSGDPHELRIAGKSLRYTLEMAKAHGVDLPPSVMSLFKRLQESLGLWHDHVVLTERILCEIVECDLALHDPSLAEQILNLSQVLLAKAQKDLKKVGDLWQEQGDELCKQIRHAFPLTRPVMAEVTPLVPAVEKPDELPQTAVS
jgi:CHAD domain-containing protein